MAARVAFVLRQRLNPSRWSKDLRFKIIHRKSHGQVDGGLLSNMDGTIDAGQKNYVIAYGQFNEFVIVDRFPASVELIMNLFDTNRRPTGQRGMFLWARTGSDSVVDNAFRLLNMP